MEWYEVRDPEIKKLIGDMATDERDIFLNLYEDLKAKALKNALQKTHVLLIKQRKERAAEAREQLPKNYAEMDRLSKERAEWFAAHPREFVPMDVNNKRDRIETLRQENERLKSVIQMEFIG